MKVTIAHPMEGSVDREGSLVNKLSVEFRFIETLIPEIAEICSRIVSKKNIRNIILIYLQYLSSDIFCFM